MGKRIYTKIVRNTYVLIGMVPISKEDVDRLNTFKDHQILKNQTSGVQKERSIIQNNWIHAIFRYVASNTENPEWNTEEKVKFEVKMIMKFFEKVVVRGPEVYFKFKSFNFEDMPQNEANVKYSEAKQICADFLGIDPKKLEAVAKEKAGIR